MIPYYYGVLKLPKNATQEDINRAKTAALSPKTKISGNGKYLPDPNIPLILEAHTILSNPILRAEYDNVISSLCYIKALEQIFMEILSLPLSLSDVEKERYYNGYKNSMSIEKRLSWYILLNVRFRYDFEKLIKNNSTDISQILADFKKSNVDGKRTMYMMAYTNYLNEKNRGAK